MCFSTAPITALVVVGCVISHVLSVVEALPSFGTRIPNGETVPCPPDLLEADNGGCTISGFCLGLGHPNCGGFRPEDRTTEDDGSPSILLLSSFGEDWKNNGFVWTRELCELDSDGDGYTNGEELGDPCCVWETGGSSLPALNKIDGFLPSHPGMDDHTPPQGFVANFDRESFCAAAIISEEDKTEVIAEEDDADVDPYDQYYNPNERREYFDFVTKPYPIPVKTTTYVDFVFNIPEDAPDLFHVVFGEAIISQPEHLHHFVLNGCSNRYDPSQEGIPLDMGDNECNMRFLGQWTPGSNLFGSGPLDSGIILGRGLGIESIQLNVHYTDGVYEDPEALTYKMATDGVRILYTPDFRPYTIARHQVINVPYGPQELFVPPGESRYFLAKTCNVESSCQDASPRLLAIVARVTGLADSMAAGAGGDMVQSLMQNLSCPTLAMFCGAGGEIGGAIQRMCPMSCGLCEGSNNPRNPESYQINSVNYHAHLLGREMYTTLLRDDDGSSGADDLLGAASQEQPIETVIQKKQGSISSSTQKNIIVKDLKSREVWYYDDQSTIPMDYDITRITNDSNSPRIELIQGTEVKPGDKIHVSCVYDSTDRSDPTQFGLSTYDEMCLTALFVSFETPQSLLDGDLTGGTVSINADLNLRTFMCAVDYENRSTDVYQGILQPDEDARNIWKDHPIEDSDMCIFNVENFRLDIDFMTFEHRNCPFATSGGDYYVETANDVDQQITDDAAATGPNHSICYGMPEGTEFRENLHAGHTCHGGEYDQRDSNEEPLYLTFFDCIEAGGSDFTAYTCADAEEWMLDEKRILPDTIAEYYRVDWWQPKCCRQPGDEAPILDDSASTSSSGTLALLAAAIVAAMV